MPSLDYTCPTLAEPIQVASLPVYDLVSSSKTDSFDWQEWLTRAKAHVRLHERVLQKESTSRAYQCIPFSVDDNSPEDLIRTRATLARAQKDPYSSVRYAATKGLEKLEAALSKEASQTQTPEVKSNVP